MISLIKIDNQITNYLTNNKCRNIFLIIKENVVIGSIKINSDINNIIDIFIKKEYRGNGHGKKAFQEAINMCKKEIEEELFTSFSNDNLIAKRLVSSVNGIHLTTENGITKYVIPKK